MPICTSSHLPDTRSCRSSPTRSMRFSLDCWAWAPGMGLPLLDLEANCNVKSTVVNPCEISVDSVGRTARHPQYTEYESLRDHKI
jgi:hypothetical protein